MAFIDYVRRDDVPARDRVADRDNIIRIHGIHSRTIKLHHALYREMMHGEGPLSGAQREMLALAVSAANGCHY